MEPLPPPTLMCPFPTPLQLLGVGNLSLLSLPEVYENGHRQKPGDGCWGHKNWCLLD